MGKDTRARTGSPEAVATDTADAPPAPPRTSTCPIVGIGASAGGLEAFKQLFGLLPADTGMAFVVVQHLDPTHASFLSDALSTATRMPVAEIQNGTTVEPNHVYVIPPRANLVVKDGRLSLVARSKVNRRPTLPIDLFLRSLAVELKTQAIGVILTGSASDGTEGLRAIKSEGGITLVQEPATAKFPSMPESALRAGVVDRSLPLPELAGELVRLSTLPYVALQGEDPAQGVPTEATNVPETIFAILRNSAGVDFAEYKSPTLRRRLARRMALLGIERVDVYVKYLGETPAEAKLLLEDFLVHVTCFFRDPDAFDALKKQVFPRITRDKPAGAPIRLWVPGCATGEEVYSLAIALLEHLGEGPHQNRIQIFGSDVSEEAIQRARAGVFTEAAVRELAPERVSRFFSRTDAGFRIAKAVRELCVFVRHDLGHDPPFSKLDLVSCRNALIYFGPALQKRVLGTFHYCLNEPGFLFLGRSESISGFAEFFSVVDKQHKIFARSPGPSMLRFAPVLKTLEAPVRDRTASAGPRTHVDVYRHVDRLLLAEYAPAGVIVTEAMEIVEFRGRTGPYLEAAPGQPTRNLAKMAREGLLGDLRAAFDEAKKEMTTVRRDDVQVHADGVVRACSIVVVPIAGLPEPKQRLFAVLFEETPQAAAAGKRSKKGRDQVAGAGAGRLTHVEHELAATKEYLQSLLREHEGTHDELISSNEELLSGNEELQSLNEELETAKEELQSSNEELTTVNDEMQSRTQEVQVMNNDLVNLLTSIDVPVIIVDAARAIRRFTPKAHGLMKVLPSDVGRPIDDIRPNVNVTDLGPMTSEAIESNSVVEREVQDSSGRWHRLRIRPYKTVDNKIEGAVLSLTDIDALKRTVDTAEVSRDHFAAIVEAVPIPLLAVDADLRALSANQAFKDAFSVAAADLEGRSLFAVCEGAFDLPVLRAALTGTLTTSESFHGLELEQDLPGGSTKTLSVSARPVRSPLGSSMLVVAIEDISQRRSADKERARLLAETECAKQEAESANASKDLFLAVLSHELRTPLSAMLLQTDRIRRGKLSEEKAKTAVEGIDRAIATQTQLIDDILDVSRIATGKLRMDLREVDVGAMVSMALESVESLAAKKSITIATIIPAHGAMAAAWGDPLRLRQVVWNLLSNAIKYTPEQGTVDVTVDAVDGDARIRVTDTGKGIDAALLPHVFERFVQAPGIGALDKGLGLGLAIVKNIVEAHHGTVSADSGGPGSGATFTVTLPLGGTAPGAGDSDVTSLKGVVRTHGAPLGAAPGVSIP